MSVCSIRFTPVASIRPPASRHTPAIAPTHVSPGGTLQALPRTRHGILVAHPQLAAQPLLSALRGPQPVRARPRSDHQPGSFSHQLFMDTIDYHKQINMHPSIETLRGAKVASARVYWRMLVDKLAFHEALEGHLQRHRDEPLLEPFYAPVLPRSKRLRADLHALADKPHAHIPRPAPASDAARAYIEALDLAARQDPRALAAHAWLHYLGDMHGGQLMRGRLAERHGEDTVTSFCFTEPVDALKMRYGRALDMPLTAYEKRLLQAEAVEVYRHSLKMHDRWSNP